MNLPTLLDLGFSNDSFKFETLHFLTEYYQHDGKNQFKAAEFAEINMQNFISYAQNNIATCIEKNTCSPFANVNRSIIVFNPKYLEVAAIYQDLKKLPWQEFEDFCGTLLRKCFDAIGVNVSQPSNDGGIDFSATLPFKPSFSTFSYGKIELYGQAKSYANNVGIVDINSFIAVASKKKRDYEYPAQIFIFCTTSDFNRNAASELKKNHFIGFNGLQMSYLVWQYLMNTGYSGTEHLKDFLDSRF